LIATGREPVYRLLEKARELHPSLIPVIKDEIASLSGTAFYFIQDIALNREHYTGGIHHEINLACIFGMIKKRPERVVPIFAAGALKGRHKKESLGFIARIKQLLLDEKRDIESEFKTHISRASREIKAIQTTQKTPKFFQKDPLEEKLKCLKKNTVSGSIDFQGARLSSKTLSGKDFRASPLFFNRCRIENCNLSESVFSFSFFKGAVLSNVDMRNASFDTVSFDHAVFVNVNAEGAVFKNCSFQATSFFRTNFNKARIKNAVFIEAVVSASSFDYTDLSGSCFAYSKLSRVSFSTAMINEVDFSGTRARFTRFPHSSRQASRTDDIDYNARNFQLTFEEMPEMDEAERSEINMMIFCEFTHYGEMKFLKQNKLSLLTAYDIFKPRQTDLFGMIPVLIHENLNFPMTGAFPDQTPCGIADYMPSPEARSVCAAYMGNEDLVIRRNPDPAILGLFTIGSIGSIAQTSESDIDYWVCIQESALTRSRIALLEKKLFMLEKMAMKEFQIQITFFIVDITKVKENNFGDSTMESSGSAQAGLLKEEFYRTFIFLAGKIPLWAVLPTAVSRKYYKAISSRISTKDPQDRYMDIGDIHDVSPGEYFGASIWQMFKWLKSPFKSVIKMALLDKYIFKSDRDLLLCNMYKDEWMNTGAYLKPAQNDSYYFLMKHLVGFYKEIGDSHSVNLLLTCFFLKLGISKKEQIENTAFGLRKILLLKCMDSWGWDLKRVFEIGSFKTWPYRNIVRLSNALETYILQKYKKVAKSFEGRPDEISMITPEDRKVLEHKVKIEFSDQPMKVRKILLVSRGDRHFRGLDLKYMETKGEWILFNKNRKASEQKEESLIRAQSIEEIGAWLMVNGLYSENTVINMTPNPTPVTFNEINTLYRSIHKFFQPLIKPAVAFEQLLKYPEKNAAFVSVNFYARPDEKKLIHYTALYINAWHEVFCTSGYSGNGFISMGHMKRDLMFKLRMRKLPEKTDFFFSKGIGK
jgi:adenylate cyclase class 1